MEQRIERCAGLDVHKATVAACLRIGAAGPGQEIVRTFGTTTHELLVLRDWLVANGVTHVAMESTGVFWKPVYYVLEDAVQVLLVNPGHMKQVPGRKTDVSDCVWIAQLLAHGLLRGSFIPPVPIRELRDLTRYRKALIQERTREANRLHKVLQDANIKLSSVATDVLGVSGRAMLEALTAGTTDGEMLAELAHGKLRKKIPALRQALAGRFRPHHGFLISQILAHLDYLADAIEQISTQVEEVIRPFAEARDRLTTMPGVGQRTAEVIIAEIGTDMTRFPTASHLASWAGMCPGNNASAGKHRSGKTRKGNRWLRMALTESALAATRKRNSAARARYTRIMRHRGHKKAVFAVGRHLLESSFHILAQNVVYRELGADYFTRFDRERLKQRCLAQLVKLGFEVALTAKDAA